MIEIVDVVTTAATYVARKVTNRPPFLLHEIATGKPARFPMEDSFRCTQIVWEPQLSGTSNGTRHPLNIPG